MQLGAFDLEHNGRNPCRRVFLEFDEDAIAYPQILLFAVRWKQDNTVRFDRFIFRKIEDDAAEVLRPRNVGAAVIATGPVLPADEDLIAGRFLLRFVTRRQTR